jgi:hypothetical protein
VKLGLGRVVSGLEAADTGTDAALAGNGWTFTVKPGWVIREGPRRGDSQVVRQP